MKRKPVIGLNMTLAKIGASERLMLSLPEAYAASVARAGGLPLSIPLSVDASGLRRIAKLIDGMIFIGGADYRPEHYGGYKQPESELIQKRQDKFDIELAKFILEQTDLPVLGICGGCQLVNIAMGGALVQDIMTDWQTGDGRTVIFHSGRDRQEAPGSTDFRHEVLLQDGSLAATSVNCPPGEIFMANSVHHQAVHPQRLGRSLSASAWAPDGVVEAIEPAEGSDWKKARRFILGVQWHPERMQDEVLHRNLFLALIRQAAKK